MKRLQTAFPILALALYALLAFTARLAADDFCYLGEARALGVAGMMGEMYQTWSGRWAQMAVSGAAGMLGEAAPVALAVLVISLAALLAYFRWRWAGLLLLAALLVALGSYIWQGVYWLSGSSTYAVPLVLLLALTLADRAPALQVALAAAAAGFNESAGALIVLGALVYRRPWVAAAALAGTALVLAAPGSAARADAFTHPPLLQSALMSAVIALRVAAGLLIASPAALLGALAAGMALPRPFDRRMVIMGMAGIGLGIFPTLALTGAVTPRVLLLPTAALVALTFHAGQIVGMRQRLSPQLRWAAVVLVTLAAMQFASAALTNPQPFYARAGLEGPDSAWVAGCMDEWTQVVALR